MAEQLTKEARLTAEIRHLLAEMAEAQLTMQSQAGQLQAKAAREWRELSETLTRKLSTARFFQYDDSLFIQFLDAGRVQVVMATCWAAVEPFDQVWQDTIARCEIITEAEDREALETVEQKGGLAA